MKLDIHHKVPLPCTYRAARVSSMFNVEGNADFRLSLTADLNERPWGIGLIVGPSGSGKSSLARLLFGAAPLAPAKWPKDQAIIDAIAPHSLMDPVTAALSAVGLGSVPSWLRPYRHLSTGEKFRADLARILCEHPDLAVVDEFTSTIDRQVARIGAAAFAKAWRKTGGQFVGVTCHDDVVTWLQPDWVIDTSAAEFKWRRLRRPPQIKMDIYKTDGSYWPLFEPHHYLKSNRPIAADYYVAFSKGVPVAHASFSPRPGVKEVKACRLVVMPQWQGAGVGVHFLSELAAQWRRGVNRYKRPMPTLINTGHPGLCNALRNHPSWVQVSCRLYGGKAKVPGCFRGTFSGHLRALQGFRYIE